MSQAPPLSIEHAYDRRALTSTKQYIERRLCKELNLFMVPVPLIVDVESGVKDMLDHDHSCYVDQWDWERAIGAQDRNLKLLTDCATRIWRVIKGAEAHAHKLDPQLNDPRYPKLPSRLKFLHAEGILDKYPDLPRKQRETAILQEYPAVFIYRIGWPLKDGLPHENRAADYDDWVSETRSKGGKPMHGLNGDILVWNPVTRRRHELMSGGVRVKAESLVKQLEIAGLTDNLRFPYHQAIVKNEVPLSVGGGIGQSPTMLLLLRKAHLGEATVSVWPKVLKEISAKKRIHVLE